MKQETVTIVYTDANGKQFSKSFTGTQAQIDAEVERMRSQPGIKWAEVEK